MQLNTQIFVDRYVVCPLVLALDSVVRAAGTLLRRDHSLSRPLARAAVCKFKGMGSIIQATPLLQSIKKQWPGCTLTFVSTEANRALLEQIDCVDELILLDDASVTALVRSLPGFVWRLLRGRFDAYIDLEIYSQFSRLMTVVSCARNRFGFYRRRAECRFGIFTHMMLFSVRAPIAQAYLQMARLLGCRDVVTTLYPFRPPHPPATAADADAAAQWPELAHTYVVVNPNASDLRLERRWPPERFVTLIDMLMQQYPDTGVCLIGSSSERDYVDRIVTALACTEGVVNAAGRTSIPQLFDLLARAAVLVTNDTGPMHVALALGVPTVALFGPCSPEQYGRGSAPANRTHVLYRQVYCSPCVHEFLKPPCLGRNECMTAISVDSVMDAMRQGLGDTAASPPEPPDEEEILYGSSFVLGTAHRTNPKPR